MALFVQYIYLCEVVVTYGKKKTITMYCYCYLRSVNNCCEHLVLLEAQ